MIYYTAEKYILLLIRPLFLDALRAEFSAIVGNVKQTDLLTPNGVRDSGKVSGVSREQIRLSKTIYGSDGAEIHCSHINGYLMDAPDMYFTGRPQPRWEVAPAMTMGNMPLDGGNLIIEKEALPQFVENGGRGATALPGGHRAATTIKATLIQGRAQPRPERKTPRRLARQRKGKLFQVVRVVFK